jgi:hypothetical protein
MAKRFFGGQLGFWAGKTRIGKSIAQRSRRPQRGIEGLRLDGEKVLWWTARLLGGKSAHWEKHRTEVTEATEGAGIEVWMVEGSLVVSLAPGREKHASGRGLNWEGYYPKTARRRKLNG